MTIALPPGIALPALAGRELVALVLVVGRLGPLFALAPILSGTFLPARVKITGAVAIAVAVTPIAAAGHPVPTDPLAFALALGKEVAVGLALALGIAAISAAVSAGGSLMDTTVGFSFGALVDPMNGVQNGVLGQLYSIFAAMVFLLSGGLRLMVLGVARSYQLVPLGHAPHIGALGALALQGLEQVPVIGFELVAPVLLAILVTDAAFGLVARTVPQMNVFIVALPAKVLLAFAVVSVSLPLVGIHLESDFSNGLAQALQALGG